MEKVNLKDHDIQTCRVYYSDIKDCPTVSAMLTNLTRSRSIEVYEYHKTYLVVVGKKYLLDAIYTG